MDPFSQNLTSEKWKNLARAINGSTKPEATAIEPGKLPIYILAFALRKGCAVVLSGSEHIYVCVKNEEKFWKI